MPKRIAELALLGGFLILAVLLYRSTASYPETVQGSTAMYVRFLGVALGILCALELLVSWKKHSSNQGDKMDIAKNPARFWGLLLLMLVYSAALPGLGFYLSSALFLPLAMLLLGARKPISIALTSAGVLLFVYLVFARLLEVSLPAATIF